MPKKAEEEKEDSLMVILPSKSDIVYSNLMGKLKDIEKKVDEILEKAE